MCLPLFGVFWAGLFMCQEHLLHATYVHQVSRLTGCFVWNYSSYCITNINCLIVASAVLYIGWHSWYHSCSSKTSSNQPVISVPLPSSNNVRTSKWFLAAEMPRSQSNNFDQICMTVGLIMQNQTIRFLLDITVQREVKKWSEINFYHPCVHLTFPQLRDDRNLFLFRSPNVDFSLFVRSLSVYSGGPKCAKNIIHFVADITAISEQHQTSTEFSVTCST